MKKYVAAGAYKGLFLFPNAGKASRHCFLPNGYGPLVKSKLYFDVLAQLRRHGMEHTAADRLAAITHHLTGDTTPAKLPSQYQLTNTSGSPDSYWGDVFSKSFPAFSGICRSLLHLSSDNLVATHGANTSAFLTRLISSAQKTCSENGTPFSIVTTDEEFHSVNRAAAELKLSGHDIHRVPFDDSSDVVATLLEAVQRNAPSMVICSQVTSRTQRSLSQSELKRLVDGIPSDTPIVIDITQGFCNIDINWEDVIGDRKNVYLVGSTVKYGMGGDGNGFLIHPEAGGVLSHPPYSGWCASISSLGSGQMVGADGKLSFDQRFQWMGGTPGNIAGMESFTQMWASFLQDGHSIAAFKAHSLALQQVFFDRCQTKNLAPFFEKQLASYHSRKASDPTTLSNTLSFCFEGNDASVVAQALGKKGFTVDARQNVELGKSYLRIGFSIAHDEHDVNALVDALAETLDTLYSKGALSHAPSTL